MNKIYYSNELYHYGVQGQKWGVRNYQNEDGSYKPGAEGRYYNAKNSYSSAKERYKRLKSERLARDLSYGVLGRVTKTGRQINKEIKSTKEEMKKSKKEMKDNEEAYRKAKVKAYNERFEKATELADAADEQTRIAKEMYKNLAKTYAGRVIRTMRGDLYDKSDKAVQDYLKAMDKAANMTDESDDYWRETREIYMETGRNAIDRVLNNIKYEKQ